MKKGIVERVLFGLAVAAGAVWAYSRVHTYATGQDPRTYLLLAKGMLAGGGGVHPGLVAPGWPLVLAGVMRVFGVHAAFWTNVPLFGMLVGALAVLAGRLAGSGRRGAAVAAGSALLLLGGYEHNPHFLLWAFRQTPVYLTAVLALLCLERAVARRQGGGRGAAVGWLGASLAWVAAGVAVRETGVLLLPAMGLYLLADAAGWIGPAGKRSGGWWLAGWFAGAGAAAAAALAAAWWMGVLPASAQAGYLLDLLPTISTRVRMMEEMAGWIPEELGWGGSLALAAGIAWSLKRRNRGWLLLFLVPAATYLGFDGFIKAHRRFFLSTLFFLSPVAMLGACETAGWLWRALRRGLCRAGVPCAWVERAGRARWWAVWGAMVAWCAFVVLSIRPWGVRATRADVARALEAISPWAGEGRPVLLDGRARFLEDVVAVFTDWPSVVVDRGNAASCVREPPLAFVRPENRAALHWASPGPPADRILERWGRLDDVPGGGAFRLGESRYRVVRVVRWEGNRAVHRLPFPPESGMSPPPPYALLRLEAPACAAELPIRVRACGQVLAERLDPGYQFLAVPREWIDEAVRGGEDGVELLMEAGGPIPDDFRPEWLHPDGSLEMPFGPVEEPSAVSYLSEEFRQLDGLAGLDRVHPYWPAPLAAREFGGDGTIRLPEGLGAPGAAWSVKISLTALYDDPKGSLAATLSVPDCPEAAPVTVTGPHLGRLRTYVFELGRLPHPPRSLRIHVERRAETYPGNPRNGNVQIGALVVYARRDVGSLRVRVGNAEDGALLGDGFFRREHEGAPGHGRWTGGRAEVYLPLEGGRDYLLELDCSSLRPEGVPPAVPRLSLNGHPLETEATDGGLAARIPAGWLADPNRLLIETETWSPADLGAGDDRQLGIFLREIRATGL